MDNHYLEFAQPGSSIRLCLELEKQFPDLRGIQLELLKCLCQLAQLVCSSKNYLGVSEDAWLRMTITLNPENDAQHVLSAESTDYCREMVSMIMNLLGGDRVRGSEDPGSILPERCSNCFQIQTNILPGGAYLERLKELERQLWWEKVMGTSVCMRRREFYPQSILSEACKRQVSLKEEVREWRRNGGRCFLATHLQKRHYLPDQTGTAASIRRMPLEIQKIPREEVEVVLENLGSGTDGSVRKVSWRRSTYAMKSFNFSTSFEIERDVALTVSHPHIVTAFGYSEDHFDVDEQGQRVRCLLMEVMTEDLYNYAVRNDSTSFSRVDSLDVLLQVGMAMGYMHNQGVVHGDLKPNNILISHFELSGNERYLLAKLTDFGCAHFIPEKKKFQTRCQVGTAPYSAPEVLRRGNFEFEYPKKMDVYSFGAVAYEVLTGYPANEEFDINRIREGVLKMSDYQRWKTLIQNRRYPLELINLVEKCWKWAPEDRPGFEEICEDLKKCKAILQSWVSIRP